MEAKRPTRSNGSSMMCFFHAVWPTRPTHDRGLQLFSRRLPWRCHGAHGRTTSAESVNLACRTVDRDGRGAPRTSGRPSAGRGGDVDHAMATIGRADFVAAGEATHRAAIARLTTAASGPTVLPVRTGHAGRAGTEERVSRAQLSADLGRRDEPLHPQQVDAGVVLRVAAGRGPQRRAPRSPTRISRPSRSRIPTSSGPVTSSATARRNVRAGPAASRTGPRRRPGRPPTPARTRRRRRRRPARSRTGTCRG
jgi:hypothetical protein